jgi:hypothetical protein
MDDLVEQVALAIFLSQYPEGDFPPPSSRSFWPDRLDELVSGPPFDAQGYREMARAAIKAMREPTEQMLTAEEVHPSCHMCGGHLDGWHMMIDATLGKITV